MTTDMSKGWNTDRINQTYAQTPKKNNHPQAVVLLKNNVRKVQAKVLNIS